MDERGSEMGSRIVVEIRCERGRKRKRRVQGQGEVRVCGGDEMRRNRDQPTLRVSF